MTARKLCKSSSKLKIANWKESLSTEHLTHWVRSSFADEVHGADIELFQVVAVLKVGGALQK